MKASGAIQEILDRDKIRLAVEFKDPELTGFPPEMYIDGETGEPWGVGPILLNIIASDLAVEPVCVDLPWPDHAAALESGDVDMILATNTPRRALQVGFSSGRLMANRVVCLTPVDSSLSLHEIGNSKVRIACWRGSSVVDVAKSSFPDAIVREYEAPERAVADGSADVYVNDSITHRFLQLNPGLAVVENSVLSREYVHFAVNRRHDDLRLWLDNWYRYYDAQGTISKWCVDWWESFMAV